MSQTATADITKHYIFSVIRDAVDGIPGIDRLMVRERYRLVLGAVDDYRVAVAWAAEQKGVEVENAGQATH